MPLHHLPYQSSSTKLASIKQATIQKYLSLQNKMPSDFARSNYKHFRERLNGYEHLQRHDVPAYPLQSIVPDLSNGTRSSVTNAKSYSTAMPVYSNTSILGIPIPSTNYANVNNSNSVSLPNHIYSNVHIPNFQPQNLAESLPQISSATKGNENFLPPLHNPRYASRGNALLYSETPEMLQYKPKDNADAKDSDSAFTEEDPENETYISRKTVENVLNLQRHMTLSRSYSHSSVGNRNSSSSLESFDNLHCAKLNNNPVIPDPANFSRRRDSKDSGHWTGDRNSSSSSTTTENPFLTVFAAKRLMLGLNTSAGKGQLPDYGNPNTSDHGYDSYSVSSSDSYPSITNSPVKLDPRLTQIPEDWSMQEGGNDLDSKLKMVTEESGPPDCDKLCAEADLLLAKSHEKEKEGDLVMAALLSDSAAARARTAMEAPYNNSRSLVSAKMKHSTCVMRSACLYRRLKESEADERRKMKGHHSRQSSRDSTHSRHSRQGSKDSSNTKQSPKETGNQVFEDLENFGKNIEIYGTLPKKGSKKKNSMSALTSKAKDDEVYKDFLDKQRKNITTGTASTEHTSKTSKPSHSSETVKSKLCEKTSKSNLTEGAPKAPLRKKGDGSAVKDDVKQNGLPKKGKQKQPIEQSYALLFPSHSDAANEVDANNKDLLSPLNSPDKKQHRIKRKLMGGFMKRKNRSLPDLRADEELSDDFERSVDDAAISMPSTLTLPNGTLKKLEKLTDSGAVSRGFHQPHHAFIKKDLTQRPLLMKVNPPNIQSSMVNGSVSKLTHTLPSIPKKHIESKPRNETQYISDKPSKIPFKTSLNKSDIPPHPSHLLHPLKCDSKQLPQTSITQKVSSIPVLSQQSQALKCEVSNDNSTDGKIATTKNPTPSEELPPSPPPPNSFLAEIQAKRKQIIDAKDNRESPKDLRSSKPLQPINSKPSHLPKLTFGNNNEGTSWLKELQSKQMQMKQKHHDVSTSITSQGTSSQVMKEKVQAGINNSTHTKPTQSNKVVPVQQNTSEVKHRNSFSQQSDDVVPLPDESKTKNCEKKTPGSVKDLASKFEKILVKPKESPSSSTDINTSNSDGTKNQPASKSTRQQNSTETVCDSVEKSQSVDTEKTNENLHGGLPPPPTPLPEQRIAHMSLSGNSIQRPQQPPDYETAMQRLELIRTQPHSASANLHQKYMEGDKLPTPRSPSAPSSFSESPKKKSGPKKTVTFSDEVVLVACAEFDDSGFFTNPLLERVYQKHIESGGTEISHFSTVGSHNKSIKLSDTNQEVQNRSPDNTGKYNMASDDASELIPCHLCHNKYISPTMTYCVDCAFYMSRYQQ